MSVADSPWSRSSRLRLAGVRVRRGSQWVCSYIVREHRGLKGYSIRAAISSIAHSVRPSDGSLPMPDHQPPSIAAALAAVAPHQPLLSGTLERYSARILIKAP